MWVSISFFFFYLKLLKSNAFWSVLANGGMGRWREAAAETVAFNTKLWTSAQKGTRELRIACDRESRCSGGWLQERMGGAGSGHRFPHFTILSRVEVGTR